MLGYTARRLLLGVFVLWGVATVVFVIVRLVPADPAVLIAGDTATPEQLASLRKEMGLDLPMPVQYAQFLGSAVVGDFGDSYRQSAPALGLIAEALPNTALLAFLACVLALVTSLPLGLLAALRAGRPTDRAISIGSITIQALPGFWVGVVLILVFSRGLQWLPSS